MDIVEGGLIRLSLLVIEIRQGVGVELCLYGHRYHIVQEITELKSYEPDFKYRWSTDLEADDMLCREEMLLNPLCTLGSFWLSP